MKTNDLEVLSRAPFLAWVKNRDGTYLWGNRAISDLAGESVVGKKDAELVWSHDAEALRAADQHVFETGKPDYLREHVVQSSQGEATLNVCKWLDDFEGEQQCFGISFIIE